MKSEEEQGNEAARSWFKDAGVVAAHVEMFGGHRLHLPLILRAYVGVEEPVSSR